MSVCKGIQFRHLSSQLTQSEINEFFNQILNNHRDIINKALFQFCVKSSNDEQANTINNLLTKIIRSRKQKPKTITTQNIKLHSLPKQLIGNISSFLYQYDYINFSKSNRFIFLGCNTPNLLQELDLTEIKNYSCINLNLFPLVKTFKLRINRFDEFRIPSMNAQPIMNNLKYIHLFGDQKNDININSFMTQKWINTNNISTLQLYSFGTRQNPFDSDKLHKLLTKFPKIEYFNYFGCWTNVNPNRLTKTWPRLQGIHSLTHPSITESLINGFGNNLNFLGFLEWPNCNCNLTNINFTHLQQLVLHNPSQTTFNYILKSAINLKQMFIIFSIPGVSNEAITSNNKQVTESIIKLITNCKHLKYIKLDDNGKFFDAILNGIEKGLFETSQIKRETMKIEIVINSETEFNPMEFIPNIIIIINWLKISKIKHFMFILEFLNLDDQIVQNRLKNDLNKLLSNVRIKQVGQIESEKIKFIISNINCNINGYLENWAISSLK